MSKNRLVITVFAFFMIFGMISLAMGVTSIQCKNQSMKKTWSTPSTLSTDINQEKVESFRSLSGSESFDANLSGTFTGWVNINTANESNTINILKSALLENASVDMVFSNEKIKSVWFHTNGGQTEPTPTSANIPPAILTTISNVYSTSDTNPGPMAYIDSIGWVKINSNGEQGINLLNILDAARAKHKSVLLTTSPDGFIISTETRVNN